MAYHKFKFYEQRKNDPKWRPYYLEAMRVREQARLTVQRRKRRARIRTFLVVAILVILVFLLLARTYSQTNELSFSSFIDVLKSKINEFLN
ncbi:hypothetical protein KAG23_05530 [Enterococcus faecalis]|uniref:hypothetical protein n=1 Tax=Enterococcus faecalis TaxID=1351 RepID=UPI001B328615|nr:hypothetical protein [Enterococcus faecalis]MBP4088642.1 hypothetical protein [Enterococcus faecalis]